MSRLIVLFVVFIFAIANAKFPDNPKPCAYGDVDCIKDIITFLTEQKAGGYSSLNLIKFDPLRIAAIDIHQGNESPVNIDLQFRNSDLTGLKDAEVKKIKGFEKDLTQHQEVYLRVPLINLIGEYKISGRVLILPVHGTGISNITLVNTDIAVYFSGTPQVKSDGTYMTIKDMRLTLMPKRVYFHFANLFNNDKRLGDTMNLFLNENWQDIFREVQVSISEAFAKVFESVANNVFQKYPYDKFFA